MPVLGLCSKSGKLRRTFGPIPTRPPLVRLDHLLFAKHLAGLSNDRLRILCGIGRRFTAEQLVKDYSVRPYSLRYLNAGDKRSRNCRYYAG